MTRFMLDALNVAGLPAVIPETTLLASYVDHPEYHPQPFTQLQAKYPNHTLVSIAAHGGDAQVCDVESGAMTAVSVPSWVVRQRSLGRAPWCYATQTNWTLVKHFCSVTNVAPPLWWKADWNDGPEIPGDAIGTQYAHVGGWDSSVLLDFIPGFDSPPSPAGGGTPIGDDDMTPDQAAQLNNVYAILQNGIPGSFLNNMNIHIDTAAASVTGGVAASLKQIPAEVVAALPPAAGGDIQPLLDAINALPAETVAALKAAL